MQFRVATILSTLLAAQVAFALPTDGSAPAPPGPVEAAAPPPPPAAAPSPPPASPVAAAAEPQPEVATSPAPVNAAAPSPPAPESPAAPSGAQPQQDAAPVQKIVNRVKCTDYTAKGALKLDSQAVVVSSDTSELKTGDSPTDVVFTECHSDLMNYNSTGSKHYGLVSLGSAVQQQCLRVSTMATNDSHVATAPCSFSDDSSQFAQYFEYDESDKGLKVVGSIAPPRYYSYGQVDGFVTVSPSGDSSSNLTLA